MTRTLAILCPAHPTFYPHILRHAKALKTQFEKVEIYCIFAEGDVLPKEKGIHFVSALSTMPAGPAGFWKLIRRNAFLLKSRNPDVVEAIDPPSLIPASSWAKKSKKPVVYFSMELFTEVPSLLKKPLRRMIWGVLEQRSILPNMKIATVSSGVAKALEKKFKTPVHVVRSLPPLRSEITQEESQPLRKMCELNESEGTLLIYQGTLEKGRGLEVLFSLLEKRSDLHLALFGYGPLEHWVNQKDQELNNLHFFGKKSSEELRSLTCGADIGVLLIEALSESYRLALPGKTFEFLQAEIPVLASDLPELRNLFNEYPFGEISFSMQLSSIEKTIDRIQKGIQTGRYAYEISKAKKRLCWEEEQKELIAIFN